MKFYTKYKIRIVYDCGYAHDLWVWDFKYSQGTYKWTACTGANNALCMGADHIVCVYTVAIKKVFKFKNPSSI